MALEITEGFFGKVRLDGLRVAGAYRWPGPVHEGNGTWWSVIDRRASEEQTEALFTILGGQEQEPTTGFAIYGSTIAHEPEPLFADIDFEFDLAGRRGRFFVKNVLDATVAPIRNPVLAFALSVPAWSPLRTEREKSPPLPRMEVPTRCKVRRSRPVRMQLTRPLFTSQSCTRLAQ